MFGFVLLTFLVFSLYCIRLWPSTRHLYTDALSSLSLSGSSREKGQQYPSCIDSALDPTRVALLLETRPLPILPSLLLHFISVLPAAWTFRFVGSPAAMDLISSSMALSNNIKTGKLVLTELPSKYEITSAETVSATLTDLSFYKDFLSPAEWLLVFQTDSIICAASEHSIEDWVEKNYTWVGAPWHLGNPYGGNGGLSLRHTVPIIQLLEKETRKPKSDWEDRWLTDRLGRMPEANMPAPNITRHFSVEGIWTERPFGFHLRGSGKLLASEVWGNKTRKSMIFDYCPEVKMILNMDLA